MRNPCAEIPLLSQEMCVMGRDRQLDRLRDQLRAVMKKPALIDLNIKSAAINQKSRKMRAIWSLEAAQDLKAYHNINLEEQITKNLAKDIQKEIDKEILNDFIYAPYIPLYKSA